MSKKSSPTYHRIPTTILPIFPTVPPKVLNALDWTVSSKAGLSEPPLKFWTERCRHNWQMMMNSMADRGNTGKSSCGIIEPYLQRVNKGSRLKEKWEQMCKEKQRWGATQQLRGRWTDSWPRVKVGPGPGIGSRASETLSIHSCWASSPLASDINLWHGWLGQQGNVYCDI